MPTLHGYTRVSTNRQAEEGESLEAQEAKLRSVYELEYRDRGFTANIFRDPAESAGKPFLSRPGGAQLSACLERGDVVVFPKLDRGFRNTLDMLKTVELWKNLGVTVRMLDISVDTSTPIGEMILTVMAAVAQFERQRIRERIRDIWAHRRQRRLDGDDSAICSGRPRYGYKTVKDSHGRKKWVRDDAMRQLGACVVRWREQGKMPFKAIWLHMLTHRIYRTDKKGRLVPWDSVDSILQIYRREKHLQEREALASSKSADTTSASP